MERILKSPKGFVITKEKCERDYNKVLKEGMIIYTVTTEDGEGLVGVYFTLKEAREACK